MCHERQLRALLQVLPVDNKLGAFSCPYMHVKVAMMMGLTTTTRRWFHECMCLYALHALQH